MARDELQGIYTGNEQGLSQYLGSTYPGNCFAMLFGGVSSEFGLKVVNLFVGFPDAFDYPVVGLPVRELGDVPVKGVRLMVYLFSAPKLKSHVGFASFVQSRFQNQDFLTIASNPGDCLTSIMSGLNS